MTPIEEKIDLMLRGINLIILNMDMNQELKSDFNLEFFNLYHKEIKKEEDCCDMSEEECSCGFKVEKGKEAIKRLKRRNF